MAPVGEQRVRRREILLDCAQITTRNFVSRTCPGCWHTWTGRRDARVSVGNGTGRFKQNCSWTQANETEKKA